MIVLILVAALWLAVLVPSVISKLSERRSAGSIDHFHQRLDLLQRTGPKLVEPAYRLTGTESVATRPVMVAIPPPPVRPTLVLVPPVDDAQALGEAFPGEPASPLAVEEVVVRLHPTRSEATESDDVFEPSVAEQRELMAGDRRRLARQRRRDVFGILCAFAALTGVLGLAHPLRGAWVASGVFLALLVAFVGLAVYGQKVEAERRHMQHLRRAQRARTAGGDVESGAVKYLWAEDLAHYHEAEETRVAAEA